MDIYIGIRGHKITLGLISQSNMNRLEPIAFLLLIAISIIAMLRLCYSRFWVTVSLARERCLNLSITFVALLLTFTAIESWFGLYYVRTDFFVHTLASQAWFEDYWKPINHLGYRDLEQSPEDLSSHRIAAILGDSFVAGQGINSIDDRFSNILGAQLGKDYLAVNISRLGWNTSDELKALREYPFIRPPEIVVLSYFVNDIEAALAKVNAQTPATVKIYREAVKSAPDHSFFFNFVFWRIFGAIHGSAGKAVLSGSNL